MRFDEIVGKVSKRNPRRVVLDLLGERISKSGESTDRHPNREIVALYVACVNVLRVRMTSNCVALAPKADGWAISLFAFFRDAINLHQLRIVDVATKCSINRLDVEFQAIAGELDAISQAACKILDEVPRTGRVATCNQPTRHQLGICVNRGPKPRISSAWILLGNVRSDVLLFAVAERPAFIDLHPVAFQVDRK